jgi:hypothetical protein
VQYGRILEPFRLALEEQNHTLASRFDPRGILNPGRYVF